MTLPHRSDLFQRFQSFSGFTETSRDDKLPPQASTKHSKSAVDLETLLLGMHNMDFFYLLLMVDTKIMDNFLCFCVLDEVHKSFVHTWG